MKYYSRSIVIHAFFYHVLILCGPHNDDRGAKLLIQASLLKFLIDFVVNKIMYNWLIEILFEHNASFLNISFYVKPHMIFLSVIVMSKMNKRFHFTIIGVTIECPSKQLAGLFLFTQCKPRSSCVI